MSRLHGYHSTIPTSLGENTAEQNELRQAIGLDKPLWIQFTIAAFSAAIGAITTNLVFGYFNRRKKRAKRKR